MITGFCTDGPKQLPHVHKPDIFLKYGLFTGNQMAFFPHLCSAVLASLLSLFPLFTQSSLFWPDVVSPPHPLCLCPFLSELFDPICLLPLLLRCPWASGFSDGVCTKTVVIPLSSGSTSSHTCLSENVLNLISNSNWIKSLQDEQKCNASVVKWLIAWRFCCSDSSFLQVQYSEMRGCRKKKIS